MEKLADFLLSVGLPADMPESRLMTNKTDVAQRFRAMDGAGVEKPVALTADECRKACEKIGKEYLPGYEGRVLGYVITTEARDRYGDIVRVKGCDLSSYARNPVVMYCHEHQELPVGASLNVKVEKAAKRVTAQALFLDDRVDTSGRSELVFKFARSGMLPGCSIGFMPKKANRPNSPEEREKVGLGEWGVEFEEWELLEWSPCAIPANPEALQLSMKSLNLKTSGVTREDLVAAERAAMFDREWLDVVERVLVGEKVISAPAPVEETAPAPEEKSDPATPQTETGKSTPAPITIISISAAELTVEMDKVRTMIAEMTEQIKSLSYVEAFAKVTDAVASIAETAKRIESASAAAQQAATSINEDGRGKSAKGIYELLEEAPKL